MIIKTAHCKVCGEMVFTQFQKKCPNGCDETNPCFAGWVKEKEAEVSDEKILKLIEKVKAS